MEKVTELLQTLGGGSYLILLDNFDDQLTDSGRIREPGLEAFFEALFRVRHMAKVLVTSQIPVALPSELRRYEARFDLDAGLPVKDGVDLLRELDRDGEAGVRDADEDDLARAVHRVHGLPRALELVVGALMEDYLTLPSLDDVLNTFATRGDVVANLAQDRYQRLDAECRLVLDVLAVFGRPVRREAVEWVLEPLATDLDVRATLARLAARGRMVTVHRGSRTFAVHPMDADFIRAGLPRPGLLGRRTLDRRVADWYAREKPSKSCWRSVDDVLQHRWEFSHRIRAGDHQVAAAVLEEIDDFLIWQGSVIAVASMHEQLIGQLHDDDARLAHLVGYGLTQLAGGSLGEAARLLQEAVALAERVGDRPRLERALFTLGDTYRMMLRLDEAIGTLIRSVALARELGEYEHTIRAQLSLSVTYSYRGEVGEALRVSHEMRAGADAANDELGRAQAANARACALIVSAEWDEAIAVAEDGIASYVRAGVPQALGYMLNAQGIGYLGLGDLDLAKAKFLQGQKKGDVVESPRIQGVCLYNLAWCNWIGGGHEDAASAAGRAVQAFRHAGGGDVEIAAALANAAGSAAKGDFRNAAQGLLKCAGLSRLNADLVPSEWLTAEAGRLATRTPLSTEGT
jgi:tetratricopeptide (TPR) repeat protein